MTTLIISIPGQPSREVKLERDRYTLGRAPDNDIVVDHPPISRHHAVFERSSEGWTCTDLDSRNGTRLDGNRIQKIVLKEGMHLKLGKDPSQAVTLTFQVAAQAKVPEAQPVQEKAWSRSRCRPGVRRRAHLRVKTLKRSLSRMA